MSSFGPLLLPFLDALPSPPFFSPQASASGPPSPTASSLCFPPETAPQALMWLALDTTEKGGSYLKESKVLAAQISVPSTSRELSLLPF